jgi:hypothetical protein
MNLIQTSTSEKHLSFVCFIFVTVKQSKLKFTSVPLHPSKPGIPEGPGGPWVPGMPLIPGNPGMLKSD